MYCTLTFTMPEESKTDLLGKCIVVIASGKIDNCLKYFHPVSDLFHDWILDFELFLNGILTLSEFGLQIIASIRVLLMLPHNLLTQIRKNCQKSFSLWIKWVHLISSRLNNVPTFTPTSALQCIGWIFPFRFVFLIEIWFYDLVKTRGVKIHKNHTVNRGCSFFFLL